MRLLDFHFKIKIGPMKGTGAKRDVYRGSSVSTGQSSRLPGGVGTYGVKNMCVLHDW